jgi:hypothetical protein
MRLLGKQFVTRTIAEAIANARGGKRAATGSRTTCSAKPR